MHHLKAALFRVARRVGLFALVGRSRWRRRRLLVLCYHGVSIDDEHEWNPELFMTQDRLRERLRLLRDEGYTVLGLSEGLERLYAGTLPPRSVALTFDDGTHDFAARALPVLREFGMPATVYLTTYYAGHARPVFNVVGAYVLWKARGRELDGRGLVDGLEAVRLDEAGRRVAHEAILAHAERHGLSVEAKDALLRGVAERLGVDYDRILARRILQIMSPDEVAALPADLVDVQLHTHRHRVPLDRSLFVREIEDNRRCIGELAPPAAAAAVHFCYPSGVYDARFLPWLRETGVRSATTCVPGLSSAASDPLLLPRFVDTSFQSALAFEGWASGFAALLPRRGPQL